MNKVWLVTGSASGLSLAKLVSGAFERRLQVPVSAGRKRPVLGANKSSPERRYPGNASNPGLRNCNLLACIRVLFSTDRGAQERPTLLTLEELVEQTSR